jgi:RimJ/RimL family protein N-acetyltransferase
MEPLTGLRVTLRPFREDELDLWVEAARAFGPDVFPAGVPTRATLRARIRRGARMIRGEIELAIEAEGRVIGDIQTQRPHPLPPRVYQLGIGLFSPADRRRGYGTEAVALFTGWLFDQHAAERVQAGTAPSNAPMRRVFERLGFTERETVLVSGREHLLYAIDRDRWLSSPFGSP